MKNLKIYDTPLNKRILSTAVAISIATAGISYGYSVKNSDEHYVKVSSSTRTEIYLEDNFKKHYQMPTTGEFKDGKIVKNENELKQIDPNITDKSLKYIKKLKIDTNKEEDIEILKYCTGIKELTIENPERLTKEDIEIINNCHLKNLTLDFDVRNICNPKKTQENLKLLKAKNITITTGILPNEVNSYILYKFCQKNLDMNKAKLDINTELMEELDKKIIEISNKMDIDNQTEEDTLISIILSVTNYLTYDEEVSESLEKATTPEEMNENEKVKEYNNYPLSSVLIDNPTNEGICVNYAALINVICYSNGIEGYYISGETDDFGHALNIIKINDEWEYLDTTALDGILDRGILSETTIAFDLYLNENISKEDKAKYKEKIVEYLKRYSDYVPLYMESFYELDNILNQEEDNKYEITYYNENNEGQLVDKERKIDPVKPLVIGLGSGVVVLLIPIAYKKRKENESTKPKERIR